MTIILKECKDAKIQEEHFRAHLEGTDYIRGQINPARLIVHTSFKIAKHCSIYLQ